MDYMACLSLFHPDDDDDDDDDDLWFVRREDMLGSSIVTNNEILTINVYWGCCLSLDASTLKR